jgi:NADH-quinone oxidoreductase subunit G
MPVQVEEGTSILDATKKVNIKIPTLCYNPDLPPWAACGICIVRMEGSPKMVRACTTPVAEGMKVITHDPEIIQVRRTVVELILSNHPNDCLQCPRNGNCELQRLAAEFGIREVPFQNIVKDLPIDDSNPSIVLNPEKCVRCGRCVKVCQEMQNVWAIEFLGRGINGRIASAADVPLGESPCIKCGQCAAHCPVGAIYERDDTRKVWAALQNKDIHPVVQIAPAVRVALGEEFGLEPGTIITKKIYAALRRLGFKTVFDTNFAADLTIIEEGTELVKRLTEGKGEIPLITTCCPAWVDYLEKYYPEMIPHFSTAKSPQQMMGAMIKTYWAEKANVRPDKIFSVSVMPCTAKKFETHRDETMYSSGYQDVDVSITTRELARMGHEVHVITRRVNPFSSSGQAPGAGFFVHRFPARPGETPILFFSEIVKSQRLAKRLREHTAFDIALVHQSLPALGPVLSGCLKGLPFIYIYHSPWHEDN